MKLYLILILIFVIYLLNQHKFKGGSGAENMPAGPERDIAIKKDKATKGKYLKTQNMKVKKKGKQNAMQRRISQLIKQNGRSFITFLWLQRKYMPNYFEPLITRNIVWFPLDEDDNFHIRTEFNFMNPIDPMGIWIPNREELERLTDMMFAHSLPIPGLFLADITIIQMEIYAKWFKKYYIDIDDTEKDNFIVKGIKDFINSL